MSGLHIFYLAMIFLAVASGVLGLSAVLFRPRVAPERLKGEERVEPGSGETAWQARVVKLAEPIAKLVVPEGNPEDYSRLRLRFLNAGFRHRSAMAVFYAAKVFLSVLMPVLLVLYVGIADVSMDANLLVVAVLAAATGGFILPSFFLDYLIRRRQRLLFEAFPDATDLLVVCMEAGLGLDAAINRAADEIRVRSPELADELYLVTLELRVGATREQALRNLSLRTGLEDVASLVTMLVQADRFGTNIADALRVHADSLRVHRHMLAEESAAKVAVKLVFPVVLCIFPALMLVLGGPPFLAIYRNFLPVLNG
ncbi:MAG: type II secretion system F family protein [Actinomycetota bacterium]